MELILKSEECSCDDFSIKYILKKISKVWSDKEVHMHNLVLQKMINGDLIEEKEVEDITTNEKFAVEIYDKIKDNFVTPCTLLDCVYNLIVEGVTL